MTWIAYCGADGALHFGPTVPQGMLTVAKLPDGMKQENWQRMVCAFCRLSYTRENKHESFYLVPGLPECDGDQIKGVNILNAFTEVLYQCGLDRKIAGQRPPSKMGKARATKAFRALTDVRVTHALNNAHKRA